MAFANLYNGFENEEITSHVHFVTECAARTSSYINAVAAVGLSTKKMDNNQKKCRQYLFATFYESTCLLSTY